MSAQKQEEIQIEQTDAKVTAKDEVNLTKEQEEVYDRQSFLGHVVQKRLINSMVLLIDMTGCNTELAKNLILAGANITIFDNALIEQYDVDTNFLFGVQDLGQNRGAVAQSELKQINPLVKIELITNLPSEQLLQDYNIIVTSTKVFQQVEEFDRLSQKLNIPYYNLVCCGFYGYVYISLGREYIYEREKRVVRMISFGDKKKKEPQYKEFEQVTASSVELKAALDYKYKIKGMQQNLIYYCILMMNKAQEQNITDIEQIVEIGCKVYQEAVQKEIKDSQKEVFRNFAKHFGIDFCPVYSILGSVASQEMILTISRVNEPAINWFCYDSEEGYGLVEVVQDVEHFIVKDLPHRRQLIQDD